ncbi:MAG: BatA domain-containing protein [Tumebacillaceae bacterium]
MNLLNPWMLSFLTALPVIIIFYLLKRTYENTLIPSTLLWQKLLREMEANRPWQKLRRNLLLLLQLLMAALLALALARPALPADGPAADHTITVLDLSPSMAPRLAESKKQVENLINKLAPNQRLTLISMGREARILASGSDPSALEKALEGAEQEYGKADYEGALSLAAALSAKDRQSDVRIYSDGNWGIDPKMLPRFGTTPSLVLPAADGKTNNVAIQHAAARIEGEASAVVATVANEGDEDRTVNVSVLDSAGKELDSKQLQVAAGKQASVTWERVLPQESYKVVLGETDDLLLDNERTVLPERSTSAKAWVATPGNIFLEKALSLGGRLKVERATDPNAPPPDASLYVYDGVLPKEWPNGSVLLVNPPEGAGLITAGGEREPGKLQTLVPDSPLLQHVDLTNMHLKAAREVQGATWLQPIVKSGETPLLISGEQGGRRIAILPFDLHQTDLPLLPSFPILMKNLQEYLLPVAGPSLGEHTVGERVALLPPIREQGWSVTEPNGTKHAVGKEMIEQGFRPQLPGLYRFENADDKETRLLSATVPAEESQIKPTPVSLTGGSGEESGKNVQQPGMSELWRWLALAVLLLLFVEWGVYKRGY